MKKLTCDIEETFGYWSIIDNTTIIKNGHTHVLAKCKCGKEQLVGLSDLKNKRSSGCKSCKARERGIDIQIGDKHKHWTIINGPKLSKNHNIIWEAICDCGKNTRWMQGNELTNPNRCFQCYKCAAIKRGNMQASNNGKIGDLYKTKYTKIKRSAEIRNIEFKMSIKYLWDLFISQKQKCAITGDYIECINNAPLDRLDSSIGYVKNNVQWVTPQSNISKHVMTMNELYEFCKKVLNYANQQPSSVEIH